MCGIVGQWNLDGQPILVEALTSMTHAVRHRGPDDEGYVLIDSRTARSRACGGEDTDQRLCLPAVLSTADESFDLAFGFRRLSILDLTPAGHQPMSRDDGRLWIVYNGEIYNYLELRAELEVCGHHFASGADTEVILAAYQEWGPHCLARFNGMWALAIWDGQERSLFLARDRFGIKPLYYAQTGHRFRFGSEIKALVGRGTLPFEPDDTSVYRYVAYGVLPRPSSGQTFFRNVRSLPPGHWMCVRLEAQEGRRYWSLPLHAQAAGPGDRADAVERCRELLTDAVRLHLRSDVAVGTCLSGGLDSSSLVCIINGLMLQGGVATEQIGTRQRAFSAVYESEGRYNERAYVESVLRATKAAGHLAFPSVDRLRDDAERLVWHQDEPFLSTSIFAQWCVMSAVRENGVTVLLDGQGADELWAGYRPFSIYIAHLLRSRRLGQAVAEARAIRAQSGAALGPTWAVAIACQAPRWVGHLFQEAKARQRFSRSALDRDFAAGHRVADAGQPAWDTYRDLDLHLADLIEQSNLPDLLRYEDRNSMAFGVEARVPYLDYRLVEFAFGEAAPWRIHQGWTKWILRQAMAGTVPDDVLWRRDKVGFETPEADWLRGWLMAEPELFGPAALSRRYLDLPAVRLGINRWLAGGGSTQTLWRWINLELWLRVWSAA